MTDAEKLSEHYSGKNVVFGGSNYRVISVTEKPGGFLLVRCAPSSEKRAQVEPTYSWMGISVAWESVI